MPVPPDPGADERIIPIRGGKARTGKPQGANGRPANNGNPANGKPRGQTMSSDPSSTGSPDPPPPAGPYLATQQSVAERAEIALATYTAQTSGRPTKYSPRLAKTICTFIRTTTLTLNQICEQCGIGVSNLMVWLQQNAAFQEEYALAQEYRQELRADEIIEIADNSSNDWVDYETKSGRLIRQYDYEHSRRSELRIKTRQWLMERYGRRRFSPNVQVEVRNPLEGLSAQNDGQRLADAVALMDRVRRVLAEAETSDAEYVEVPSNDDPGNV